jgi:predicted O-linked N-acetylglucosamine transferase (SPINDLY family)
VPVVTLLGERHCERTTASILTDLGVTELIAETEADYVRLAKEASIREHRLALSSKIGAHWASFADPKRYVQRWENLLQSLHARA